MGRKQVRFVGNCQANAMAGLYREFVGAPNGEEVIAIDDLGLDAAALLRSIEGADMVVAMERDFKHGLTQLELRTSVKIHVFPMVIAGFLWPHANESHVHNLPERPISDGPYPSQIGDSFLNRMIRSDVSPEEALQRYLELDIAKYASLDRLVEIYLDKQRERDVATGFSIAPLVEGRFRTERLFLTAEHPDGWLFGVVARQLFERMGVPGSVIETALETLTRSPFPPTELPLHPGVIAHFGLPYADEATRYPMNEEGRFTFSEYVLRYMRYENNPELRAALYMATREDSSLVLEKLYSALETSPLSVAAHRTKGDMLFRLGRVGEAIEALQEAIRIAPDHAQSYADLALMLSRSGQSARACEVAEQAIAVDPKLGGAHSVLAEARIYSGDLPGALMPAREGVRLSPGRAHGYRMFAMALHGTGQSVEAEGVIRTAMLIEPEVADHRNLLAEILEAQQRREEALDALEEGIAAGWKNDQTYSLLGNFLLWAGALDRAEQAFAEGAELYDHYRPDLRDCMIQVQQIRAAAHG
ncbi:MAG: tetratricopeptide repeat protein [Methylobacteriaceae bacterium]|nr:tetratricopeptide repeat protein [Methylobacteriaceae bacterium]